MTDIWMTASALEVVRAIVALFGLSVSLQGRAVAREQRAGISVEPSADTHVRREREQRDDRMLLYEMTQSAFCAVHAMLLANALIQMGYPGAPLEQANVLFSNVTQVMIPLVLARVSEHITIKMRTAGRLNVVSGPRDTENGGGS